MRFGVLSFSLFEILKPRPDKSTYQDSLAKTKRWVDSRYVIDISTCVGSINIKYKIDVSHYDTLEDEVNTFINGEKLFTPHHVIIKND